MHILSGIRRDLDDRQGTHLEEALGLAKQWLDPQKGGASPETRWLEAFADPERVDDLLVRDNRRVWAIRAAKSDDDMKRPGLIRSRIMTVVPADARADEDSRTWLAKQVEELAVQLGKVQGPGRERKERSWASKILLHVWPQRRVFVWDSRVRLALNARIRGKLCANPSRGYTYRQLLDECEKDLNELRDSHLFNAYIKELIECRGDVLLRCGHFTDLDDEQYATIIRDFLERRLYDKYLWVQGDFLSQYAC